MSKQNSTICKLCQKVLAQDEANNHHCEAWCEGKEDNVELQGNELKK